MLTWLYICTYAVGMVDSLQGISKVNLSLSVHAYLLHTSWIMIIGGQGKTAEVTAYAFQGQIIRGIVVSSLASFAHSGTSQLPCHEDTRVVHMKRDQPSSFESRTCWKWLCQPQTSLQMTTALINPDSIETLIPFWILDLHELLETINIIILNHEVWRWFLREQWTINTIE